MPVVDRTIMTGFRDQMLNTDFGSTGWVLKDYIIDVYPNLAPGVKTPALWLWGNNSYGQLGDGTFSNSKSSPVQTIAGGTNWKQVSCGYRHTAAVKTDGTLWLWGDNGYGGNLGDGTKTDRFSPVQTIAGGTNWKQVSCGQSHTAAVKTDGTLWLWGSNSNGQLGSNSTVSRSSPVQTITGGTTWTQVSCGDSHTACIKSDGTLWTWGLNSSGQLGDNTVAGKSSPVQTITGGTTWKQVSCGTAHTACVKTDGTLWLWGANGSGRLGDNSIINRSSPVQTIAGGTNWTQASCSNAHTACVKTDGSLWLWGSNSSGVLGDNSGVSKSSPIQTIARGSTWKLVSAGYNHTACVKSDGTLWMWGAGSAGQLGSNSTVNRSSPVQTIMGGATWRQASCSPRQGCTAAIADGNY